MLLTPILENDKIQGTETQARAAPRWDMGLCPREEVRERDKAVSLEGN